MHRSLASDRPAESPAVSLALRQAIHSADLLEALPIGVYICDRDGTIVQYNRRAADLWGREPEPGSAHERFCGSHRLFRTDGHLLPHEKTPMARVLQTGEAARDETVIVERPDGTRLTVLVNIDPLHDEGGGDLVGAVNCFQDISELKRAQERLSERERWYRDLLEALPAAIYTTDAEGRITYYNQAAVDLSGRRPQLGSDEWCVTWRLYWPDGRPLPHDECPMAMALKEDRPIRDAEAVAERPDGTTVPFLPYPTPLHDASGALVGAVNMLVDISERKEAETQQQVLINELNHRVKNTLATVQSLAAQTFRNGVDPDSRELFTERLLALSRAHDQLTRESWRSADLRRLIDELFAPYRSNGHDPIRLNGEPVRIPPRMALTLSMVLHEMATNAAKYGSLSRAGGTLDLDWAIEKRSGEPSLVIAWRERGGPPVTEPTARGFGTRLVERGIAGELRGSAELTFDPAGVRCRIAVPFSA